MKLLLLDRDGTLNVDVGRSPQPADIRLLPGVLEGLGKFRDAGWTFVIVTNQGAVGDGADTEENVRACQERLLGLLREGGVDIRKTYACFHARAAGCSCRKPAPGMWEQVLADVPEAATAQRVMIGDKDADVLFARAAGCFAARMLGAYPRMEQADLTVRSLDELADCLLPSAAATRVMPLADAAAMAAKARAKGKTVVTTNGSFDLLHAGHEFLLREARRHGDVLIVGVNSDASVRGYKGPGRPVQPERFRAAQAARHADAVFVFSDPDPRPWLPAIRPDVHVNSAQYGKECVEAPTLRELGARLELVPVDPALGSTTALLASSPRGT